MTRVRHLPLVIISLVATFFAGSAAQARLPEADFGRPIAPRISAPVVPLSSVGELPSVDGGIFGSVAIPIGSTSMSRDWDLARQTDFTAFFTDDCEIAGLEACDSALAVKLKNIRERVMGMPPLMQLAMVNRAVNGAIRYKSDMGNWGVEDKWATPSEVALAGAGDCEDFAIAKMWMLRSLGFSEDQLQLVVLRDTRRGLHHAVLSVHIEGERHILDNLRWRVVADTALTDYMPLMSFMGSNTYIHGVASGSVKPAAGARSH